MNYSLTQKADFLEITGMYGNKQETDILAEGLITLSCTVTCEDDPTYKKEYDMLEYISDTSGNGRVFSELLRIPTSDLLDMDTLYTLSFKANEIVTTLKYLDVSRVSTVILELADSINLRKEETSGVYEIVYTTQLGQANTTIILTAVALLESIKLATASSKYDKAFDYLQKIKNTIIWIQ